MDEKSANKMYAETLAAEKQARAKLENILNMQGPNEAISMATAGNPNVDIGSVPSVGSLANVRAVQETQSRLRTGQAKRSFRDLPRYARSYNQYLRWRYPTRYGSGTGVNVNYGSTSPYGGVNVPPLTGIPGIDLSGDGM